MILWISRVIIHKYLIDLKIFFLRSMLFIVYPRSIVKRKFFKEFTIQFNIS